MRCNSDSLRETYEKESDVILRRVSEAVIAQGTPFLICVAFYDFPIQSADDINNFLVSSDSKHVGNICVERRASTPSDLILSYS